MGLKIFAIILLLLVMEITFLSTQEPITFQVKPPRVDFSDITFEKLDAYMITPEGLKAQLQASKAESFKTRDELYDINATLYFRDHSDYLQARKALWQPETLHLTDDVRYDSNHTLLFKSDDLVYNVQSDIAVSGTPFRLEQNRSIVTGTYLEYHAKARYVKADRVTFTTEEEE